MDYPLLLGGEKAGLLHVEQQGLYTCMEISTPAREGLLRIWVQGAGQEAYLGLLQPVEGGMTLRRRLSRRDLAAFPPVIEQASDQRLPPQEELDIIQEPEQPAPALPIDAPEPEPMLPTKAELEAPLLPAETPAPEPLPAPLDITGPGLLWRERRDGSLLAETDGCRLLALPASLRRVPVGADLRRIGGREYLVFRY